METRIKELEKSQNKLKETAEELQKEILEMVPVQTEVERRVFNQCLDYKLDSFRMKRVQESYYTWPIEQRRKELGGYSVHHLCKSLIIENTEWTPTFAPNGECADPTYSRFYCLIVQYTTRVMSHKVFKFLRSLRDNVSRKYYHVNQAKSADALRLTGCPYNAVCPVGNLTPMPIIISDRIMELKPDFIWLGGGEVDLKLGFSMAEFMQNVTTPKIYVADITFDGYDLNVPTESADSPSM